MPHLKASLRTTTKDTLYPKIRAHMQQPARIGSSKDSAVPVYKERVWTSNAAPFLDKIFGRVPLSRAARPMRVNPMQVFNRKSAAWTKEPHTPNTARLPSYHPYQHRPRNYHRDVGTRRAGASFPKGPSQGMEGAHDPPTAPSGSTPGTSCLKLCMLGLRCLAVCAYPHPLKSLDGESTAI